MDERSKVVRRALDYPYAIPEGSFVQVGGRTVAPSDVEVDLLARAAVLAYGANAAPEALARKLSRDPDPVPVLRATLSGFDVVYSAHISPYGAVPATLLRSPEIEVDVFVAHLTAAQLQMVSATEPNYELIELPDVPCLLEDGSSPGSLSAFASRHGCLLIGGTEVALSSLAARGRTLPAMSEREVLERVSGALSPELELGRFVESCVADPDLARRHTERLRRTTASRLRQ